jgi:epoxyqueuosine reductase QueG
MNPEPNGLVDELRAFSTQRGADLFGVADLAPARDTLVAPGNALMEQLPRAVSVGMRLCDAIVDAHSPDETHRESLYWHHVYGIVTPALDVIAYDIARWLTARGFEAFPVPGSRPFDAEKLTAIFSHKLAAHLAGLGWISKSCLLMTEQFGPRVRLVSILTDAPLQTDPPLDDQCGKCHVCIDTCPVDAFTGAEFRATEGVEMRFDVFKCDEYRRTHACGLCVSSCPKGSPKVRDAKSRRSARGNSAAG